MHRIGMAMFAAGLIALAGSTAAQAQNDTFRLGTSSSAAAAAVLGGTDTELVAWRGGYRHGYGSWGGRAYYRPYWGGYGYAAYYRPAYYRPAYYRPYYYRPVVYFNYYQPYYYAAPAYYPISGQTDVPATFAQLPAQTQPATSQYQPTRQPQLLPRPATVPQPQPSGNETFPYDGGPQVPLPMPQVDPASGPRPTVPLQGKIVSLPLETTGGTTPLFTVSLGTYGQPIATPRSYTYQAYGEQPLPAVRKQTK